MVGRQTYIVHLVTRVQVDVRITQILPHEIHRSQSHHIDSESALLEHLSHTQMGLDVVWMPGDATFVKGNYHVDLLISLFITKVLVDFLSDNFRFPVRAHSVLKLRVVNDLRLDKPEVASTGMHFLLTDFA